MGRSHGDPQPVADTIITPALNDPILFDFLRFTPTPVSVGDVADIVTHDLPIPRIQTTESWRRTRTKFRSSPLTGTSRGAPGS